MIVPAGLAWWSLIQQVILGQPVGQNPGPDWLVWLIWIFIGVGLPLFFGSVCLIVDVAPDSVIVHYQPFVRRVIPVADIRRVEVRGYNAIREYGGWGIKGWSREKMAYNVSGSRGVELTLADGRRLMLGSRRAEELAAAIEGQRGTRRGGERSS